MSVRAKIEAVIYAAEEPVTLQQLALLFGGEALAERRRGEPLPSPETPGSAPLFAEPAFASAETAADDHAQAPASDAAITEAVEHPEQVAATQADGFAEEAEGGAAIAAVSLADEDKRQARQREREGREAVRAVLEELIREYDAGDRGMELREIAGGYRVTTRPEYHDAVRSFVKSLKPVMKLSLPALETLAVIAYKQPVTAPEISEIRGADSGGVLGSLISRKLVTTAGRKQVIGRPILYKTTKEFLLRFGLKDIHELPSMEEFEKMAGELVETEPEPQLELREASNPTTEREETGLTGKDEMEAQPEPEHAEGLDEQELAARARASVQVDDEREPAEDLPGVTRDSAAHLNIQSSPRILHNGLPGEDE